MTQGTPATWLTRALRTICAFIDRIVYFLIAFVYQLFIQVANATLLSGSTVRTLTARVQLIFGLLLIFRLSVSVINGIINPDTLTDREKGFSEVIKRTIIVLIMFTLIVPVNVSNPTSHYQKNIANHGLLFGTMYEIQNSVLSRNVMFRLIFGGDESEDSDLNNMSSLSGQANAMAGSIYKSFMSINLADESKGEDDPSNWICEDDITDSEINYYTKADASVSDVVSLTEEWCQPPDDKEFSNIFKPKALEKGVFKFAFQPLISTVCGVFVLIMFIGFTLDIAIRAIKLAILRLIAPIPIGSYIDPKAQRDGAFASWIRITISTYIDLFIRLLIVYFAIFLVQEISTKGLVIEKVSDNILLNSLTNVVMYIAIFFFAKQAPRFISDALGLKGGGMSNLGLSGLLGGSAMLMGGGGLRGAALGMMQGLDAASDSAREGKGYSPMSSWAQNRDQMAKIRTGNREAQGGLMGQAKDYLNWSTRERKARQLGIGKKDLADQSARAKALKEQYGKAAAEKALADKNLQASAHLNHGLNLARYVNSDGSWKSDDARQIAYKKLGGEQRVSEQLAYNKALSASRAADERFGKYEKLYNDANKRADAMEKRADQMGIGPNVRSMEKAPGRIATAVNESALGQAYNANRGHDVFQGGDYRSDLKTNAEFAKDHKGDIILDKDGNPVHEHLTGQYKRDIDSSEGIADSSTIGSIGTGATGGGPPRP